ncbi:IclR family transcriptional regulator [Dendrosporobacter sp. 1207_IL3150]|uniref:IclR family transcriptional regulator n=1 Tax=Dendrosporobacter sp. 1207_IL3150 TaxID=3084054 RepID=UPI002FD8CE0E
MSKEPEIINSVDRALDILLLLQQEGKEMGVTQISTHLGMYKSTVYRTINTLENKGFIQQNPDNGKYWLGMKLYSLGMLIREKSHLTSVTYPFAKALSEKYREVVHISVLDKSAEGYPKHIIIDKVESQQVLSLTPPIGSSAPCHSSAVGKCLLAFSPEHYIEKFLGNELPGYTNKTVTDWDKLIIELAEIRKQGYAVDDEELELGLTCIAGPIFGRGSDAIAALSLSGPTSRVKSDRFQELAAEIIKTTKLISSKLR